MTAEKNLLDAARRHNVDVPPGLESLLRRARRAGARLSSGGRVSDIDVIWSKTWPTQKLALELAALGLIAWSPHTDSWWSWNGLLEAPEPEFPAYKGAEALETYSELCSGILELPAVIAIEFALKHGLDVTMSIRRVARAVSPRVRLFAVLDVDAPRHKGQLPTYAEHLAQNGFVMVDGSTALRTACEVTPE